MTTMAAMTTVTTKFRLGLAACAIAIVAFVSVVPAVAPPVHAVPAAATHVLVPAAPIGPLPLQAGICTLPLINVGCAFVGFFDPFIDSFLSILPFGLGAEGFFIDALFDLFLPFAPYEP
jgi:hypothetical protein